MRIQNSNSHGFGYNFVFGIVMLTITLIFGAILFVIANVDAFTRSGFNIDMPGVVLLVGGALGLIAILSALVYFASRADNYARAKRIEEMEKLLRQ